MRIPLYGRLASRLRELGLSQSDLAYALGLSPTAISLRMSGKIAWDIREMYRTLEVCRAKPDELHLYFPDPNRKRGATASAEIPVTPFAPPSAWSLSFCC